MAQCVTNRAFARKVVRAHKRLGRFVVTISANRRGIDPEKQPVFCHMRVVTRSASKGEFRMGEAAPGGFRRQSLWVVARRASTVGIQVRWQRFGRTTVNGMASTASTGCRVDRRPGVTLGRKYDGQVVRGAQDVFMVVVALQAKCGILPGFHQQVSPSLGFVHFMARQTVHADGLQADRMEL
jgi:hypothetical protein